MLVYDTGRKGHHVLDITEANPTLSTTTKPTIANPSA